MEDGKKARALNAECERLRKRVAELEAEARAGGGRAPDDAAGVSTAESTPADAQEILAARLRLYEFGQQSSLHDLLVRTLDEAEALTDSCIGFFHFVQPDQYTLSLQAWSTRTTREFCTAVAAGAHYDVDSAGVWADCLRQRRAIIHNDYASLPHKKGLPAGHARLLRELTVPVMRQGKVVAILGVGNKPTDYTPRDLRVIDEFASSTWEQIAHRRAEEELGARTRILQQIGRAVITVDLDDTIMSWNQYAEELYQWSSKEALGQRFTTLLAPQESMGIVPPAPQPPGQDGRWEGDYEVLRKDGTRIPVHVVRTYLQGPNGENIGYISVSNDITGQRQVERQLIQSQKMEAMGVLAGGVAHDMNNILAVILGLGSVLEEKMGPAETENAEIRQITAAARRGRSLVENLVGFARKGAYQRETFVLNDVARKLVGILSRTITKQVEVRLDLADDLAPVHCDVAQITQVLMNLCVNAVDATRGRGVIRVATFNTEVTADNVLGLAAGDYVCMTISDDGAGMDEETVRRAFEPFFTTKQVGKGSGLGLAMAHGVVCNHGGAIRIESAPAAGTTVSLWLPVATSSLPKPRCRDEPPLSTETSAARRPRLLIVDDEELVRATSGRMATMVGFDVTLMQDGASALQHYKTHCLCVDLILLDLSMPGMDGAQCYERLREINPEVRVLISTGHGADATTERMLAHGAAGVLRKPFDFEQFKDALFRALRAPARGA